MQSGPLVRNFPFWKLRFTFNLYSSTIPTNKHKVEENNVITQMRCSSSNMIDINSKNKSICLILFDNKQLLLSFFSSSLFSLHSTPLSSLPHHIFHFLSFTVFYCLLYSICSFPLYIYFNLISSTTFPSSFLHLVFYLIHIVFHFLTNDSSKYFSSLYSNGYLNFRSTFSSS